MPQGAIDSIKDPNQSILGAGRGQQMPIVRERESSYPGIVSHDELGPLRGVELDPNFVLSANIDIPYDTNTIEPTPCERRHTA